MSGLSGVQAQPLNNPSPFIQSAPPQQIQIPDQAGRFNPLAAQAQALQNQGQANANQISQIDVQKAVAQRAIGQHIQQTLNADGTPNYTAAMTAASNDPHSALGMQDFATNAIANGNIQASTASTLLDNATKRYANFANSLGRLVNKGPNVSLSDMANVGAETVASGLNTSDDMLTHLDAVRKAAPDTFNANGQPNPNPALQQYIKNVLNGATGAQNALQNAHAAAVFHDVGGQQVPVSASVLNPPVVDGPSLVNTPSPDQLNAPQGVVDAVGRPMVKAAGAARQFVNGNGQVVNPAAPGTAPTALDPQSQDMIQNVAPEITKAANDAQPTLNTINNLQTVMATTPEAFGSGKGVRANLARILQAVPTIPQSVVDGVQGGNLSSFQEAQKLMFGANYAMLHQFLGGQGRMTAQEEGAAREALLNPQSDPRATAEILRQVKQQAELPVRKAQAWQKFYDKQQSDSPYIDPKTKQPARVGQFNSIWQQGLARSGRTGMSQDQSVTGQPSAPPAPTPPNLSATPPGGYTP